MYTAYNLNNGNNAVINTGGFIISVYESAYSLCGLLC